jgi:hypothetical protein
MSGPFSALAPLSLPQPQPTRGGPLTSWLCQIVDLVGFEAKGSLFPMINLTFGVAKEQPLLCTGLAELATTARMSIPNFLAIRLESLLVSKRVSEHNHQIALAEWSAFDQKKRFGDMKERSSVFSASALPSSLQPSGGKLSTCFLAVQL